MAAACPRFVIVAWVPLYLTLLFVLEEPPEWHATSQRRCKIGAHGDGRPRLGSVFAVARKAKSGASVTHRKQTHHSAKGHWVFLPFAKLKYRWFGWSPVDRIVAGTNMDVIFLLAGTSRGDVPRVIQATLDDLMILFFRWFDEENLMWPLQREVTKSALFREHYRYARQFLHEVSAQEQQSPVLESRIVPSVQDYRRLSAAQLRLRRWLFDGNTFVRRERTGVKSAPLTENDVDFMRGLPLSVLRIARGVFAPSMPVSVARLSEELRTRNITTANQLLEETNFIDFFALFDLFDEAYTQVDVLREFYRNWVNEDIAKLPRPSLPPGGWTGARNLTALLVSPKTSPAEFPKCSTLKCFMGLTWGAAPVRSIKIEKTDVNSLKLLLVGNTGVEQPPRDQERGWLKTITSLLGFDELQQTVAALKDWHGREKADAVLGLGSILGIPSATSVRSERFETRWYNIFVKVSVHHTLLAVVRYPHRRPLYACLCTLVTSAPPVYLLRTASLVRLAQDAGLDVPWLMTVGEDEGVLSPATLVRYHYTLQHPNWHMPNDMYTVDFQFQANMTLEGGAIERDAFNVTVVNLNTWALLAGNPITNHLHTQVDRMMWISRQLFAATKRNPTWLLVMGHHPIVSTGVEGKEARMQYLEDVYTGSHYRGWEHLIMHHLFFHYRVDAYISGHDYLMEYNTMEDLDTNTTISFINSGAAVRLMDRSVGRGWIGRLRGALYPVLCFAGRRILFLADPGGCEPRGYERSDATGWFAPKFGNYKINIGERVMRATGFTSLQLTKEYMIVEFIDARTKKPATRRLQRRSNKAARDVAFASPIDVGRKKYAEVQEKREEFVRANLDLVRKEIYFAKRCPVLAERVTSYIREINSMVDRYDKIRREKEAFQRMTDMEIEDAAAVGLDWDMEVERASAEMRAVSKYHHILKEKYRRLLAVKDTLPAGDDPRYKELLQHEKSLMSLKRSSLALVRRLGLDAPVEVGEQYASSEQKIAALSATIEDLEKKIRTSPARTFTRETGTQTSEQDSAESKEKLISRLLQTEEQLRQMQKTLREASVEGDPTKSAGGSSSREEDLETKLRKIRAQLATYLEPLHPSFLWKKHQELSNLKAKTKYLTAYLARVQSKSPSAGEAAEDGGAVTEVQSQLEKLQSQVQNLQTLLEYRDATPLQQQYLDKKAALARAELVEAQGKYLDGNEKDVHSLQQSLTRAAEAKKQVGIELQRLERQVEEELQEAVREWEERQRLQEEKMPELDTATKQEAAGQKGTQPRTARKSENRSEADLRNSSDAGAAAEPPPSKRAEGDGRRLAAMTGDGRTRAKPPSRRETTSLLRVSKEPTRSLLANRHFEGNPAAVRGRARALSASQPLEASAQNATGANSASVNNVERSAETSWSSTGEPSAAAKTSRKEVVIPAAEVGRPTNSSQPPPKAADGQSPHNTLRASREGKVDKPRGMGGTVGRPEEAPGDELRKNKASPVVARKPLGDKQTPVKKRDQKAPKKSAARAEMQGVPNAPPFEEEDLEEDLDKVDVGPQDGCLSIPILDVMVRRALNPEENAASDTKCEKLFADRALSRQLVTLTNNQILSRGSQGLGSPVHPVPSVHVSRAWRLYFQDSPKIMYKALMKDLKAGLAFVEKTFERATEATALREKVKAKEQEMGTLACQNTTLPQRDTPSPEETTNSSSATKAADGSTERRRSENESIKAPLADDASVSGFAQ